MVRLVSSTNMLAVEAVKQFGKSFTYIRNSNGPKFDPCETPQRIGCWFEIARFILHIWILQKNCLYKNLFPDSCVDVTSVNFNSKNVYEDEIFSQQDILQFFSGESKDYKYSKSPQTK